MPMYVQVCEDEVLEVFEDKTLEYVNNNSQEWANLNDVKVTVYEVVATHKFEPEDEEEDDEDGITPHADEIGRAD